MTVRWTETAGANNLLEQTEDGGWLIGNAWPTAHRRLFSYLVAKSADAGFTITAPFIPFPSCKVQT